MKSNNATLPLENIPQPEDMEIEHIDRGFDDSNVPIQAVIENIIEDVALNGFVVGSSGGLEVDADAENFEVDGCDKELGRGKRQKKANRIRKKGCSLRRPFVPFCPFFFSFFSF